MNWPWSKKPEASALPIKVEAELTPGTCECGHMRCVHDKGLLKCRVGYPKDEKWPDGADCACQVFILDPDSDGSDEDEDPSTPSPEELENLYRRTK